MFKKILMVCTGNICRSPAAQALLSTHFTDTQSNNTVNSAGIHALIGSPAAEHTQTVLKQLGVTAGNHSAQQISDELLKQHDLILVMDQTHLDCIIKEFPHYKGKVQKLGRWQNNHDIADPYGKSIRSYELMMTDIQRCLQDWVDRYFS